MEIFLLTLNQMLLMFLLILVGIIVRKAKILPETATLTLSKLETYILVPALNFYNWSQKCTVSTLIENSKLILYGLALLLLAMGLAYPLSKLFVKNPSNDVELDYERNIYKYALTFGNYGYVGNFIVLNVWGQDAFFQYSMFVFVISFMCASWGLYILAPKSSAEKQTVKSVLKRFFTPPVIAMLIGAVVGITNTKEFIPDFVISAASNAGNCMGPIAMILAGFVVGGYNLKKLFCKKKVYVVTVFRLVVIPSIFMLLLYFAKIDKAIMTLELIAFSTPLGLNTIIYPASYGKDTSTGAAMTMVSQTISVITIPIMYYVFIVGL